MQIGPCDCLFSSSCTMPVGWKSISIITGIASFALAALGIAILGLIATQNPLQFKIGIQMGLEGSVILLTIGIVATFIVVRAILCLRTKQKCIPLENHSNSTSSSSALPSKPQAQQVDQPSSIIPTPTLSIEPSAPSVSTQEPSPQLVIENFSDSKAASTLPSSPSMEIL